MTSRKAPKSIQNAKDDSVMATVMNKYSRQTRITPHDEAFMKVS